MMVLKNIKKTIIVSISVLAIMLLAACSIQPDIQLAETSSLDAGPEEMNSPTEEPIESEPTVAVTENSQQTEVEPINDEEGVRYISSMTDRYSLDTFDKLNDIAEYVVTGICISSKPVFREDLLYSLSEIQINDVYRGDNLSKGDVIIVIEWGGRTTYGEYEENCHIEEKAFKTGERMPSDFQLIMGMDGYFPLKENEQVLLFLGEESGFINSIDEPLYGVWGDYDGKLFLQPDGVTYARPLPSNNDTLKFGEGTLVITIDELNENVK